VFEAGQTATASVNEAGELRQLLNGTRNWRVSPAAVLLPQLCFSASPC
jgi:hypothetical protein